MSSSVGRVFPRGYTPEAQILVFVGIAILASGVAVLLGTAVFPPTSPRGIPATVVGALIILGIGLSIAVGALVIARPSEGEKRWSG